MALTDKAIYKIADSEECNPDDRGWGPKFSALKFARAIEAAATAPLLERIAELERHNKALVKRREFDVRDILESTKKLVELENRCKALTTQVDQAAQPVASVKGYFGGQCVIEPTNSATLLTVGLALYTAPPKAVSMSDPIAYLWQHVETGRTKIVMKGDVFTTNDSWSFVGPLVLGDLQSKAVQLTDEQAKALVERCAKICDEVKEKGGNILFRLGADVCAGNIRQRLYEASHGITPDTVEKGGE